MENNANTTHSNTKISELSKEKASEPNTIKTPEISLPKGGGALKGIDEKFEVNSANGTAGFSIPLPATTGRNNFSPSLTLSYNSGSGNGPFGLGWSLDYPMIQRKTDKRLPEYTGISNEDTFILSGAEDLVPSLMDDGNGNTIINEHEENGYTVKRYMPRIEGGFARIEKINHSDHGTYWKVTTRENTVTIFGRSAQSCLANPEDETQIFKWLPEFSYDDKGNCLLYEYKQEDLTNVPNELYEKNRINGMAPFANSYLKSIKYGNRTAYYADPTAPYNPQAPNDSSYFFELLFDYGEHDELLPSPLENGDWSYRPDAFSSYRAGFEIRTNRLCKRVLMFHHFPNESQFVGSQEEENFGENYLVRSLELEYEPSSINDSGKSETIYLQSITQTGYIRKPDSTYSIKSLPPIEFTYKKLNWNTTIKKVSPQNVVNAPVGLSNNYQWVDLYGHGISGILTEQAGEWFYKSNLGDTNEDGEVSFTAAKKVISKPSFTGLASNALFLQDLDANGEKQVVVNNHDIRGYFDLTHDGNWKSFKPFEQVANVDFQDSNTRLFDLNGDGQPDVVMTEENVISWYPSTGKKGHSSQKRTVKPFDEEKGPAIVFADQEQTIFLADMSGDGLTDIVRIRNQEICYWANKGHGKFSAKVNMGNAPVFDHSDSFNPKYLHLADVSGTGATDVIYLGENTFKVFINLSGNTWSDAHKIEPFLPINSNTKLSVVDLLGTGTSCIVWSSDLPDDDHSPMKYIDLMNSQKPHVLTHYSNNLGKETTIEYKSSTHYYLKDKLAGKPWITKLPFPVQVVSKRIVEEKITDVRFSSFYSYHHGYYDHSEREFRGFGRVEQTDTEHYGEWHQNNDGNQLEKDERLYQKPILTKSWFHTGAFIDRERILDQFKREYWFEEYNRVFQDSPLDVTEPELPNGQLSHEVGALIGDEYREALRACKGMMLRQEVFALDASDDPEVTELQLQMKPYTVGTHNCNIQLLQPREGNKFGVFLVTESEAISIQYERDETDFRMSHTLNTKIDELGNVLESVSVLYGRSIPKAEEASAQLQERVTDFSSFSEQEKLQEAFTQNIQSLQEAQRQTHIILTEGNFAEFRHDGELIPDLDLPDIYRTRLPFENRTFEITGLQPENQLFQISELLNVLDADTAEIPYHEISNGSPQRRLIEHARIRYRSDDFLTPMEFGEAASLALPFENYQLAYTPELIEQIYQRDGEALQVNGISVLELFDSLGDYTRIDDNFWIRSGLIHFLEEGETPDAARARFFSPLRFEAPNGLLTRVRYDVETFTPTDQRNNDGYYLFVKEVRDPIGNTMSIDRFNYRLLSPSRALDMNANPSSVIMDELGLIKAIALEGNGFFDAQEQHMIEPADHLSGITEWTDEEEQAMISQYLSTSDTNELRELGQSLLGGASSRFVYNLHQYYNTALLREEQPITEFENTLCTRIPFKPSVVSSITREQHFSENPESPLQFSFEYSDGLGNVVMSKAQSESGMALQLQIEPDCQFTLLEVDTDDQLRWIGNGRTILNNKGNPVKQYEPYFSTTPFFEDAKELVERGVTPIITYDALGRAIRTDLPDGTFTKVAFNAWGQEQYDQIDTVLESEWYLRRTDVLRTDFIDDPKEQNAAEKAAVHADSPSASFLDSLGRPVMSIEHNGGTSGDEQLYTTFIRTDIEGNPRAVIDARGNTIVRYHYDMLGHRIAEESMDDGRRWGMKDVLSKPLHNWDERNQVWTYGYDAFDRPSWMQILGGEDNEPLNHIYERYFYGEAQSNAQQLNLRGNVFAFYDAGGKVESTSFDFKGNQLQVSRSIAENYRQTIDWAVADGLDDNEAIAVLDALMDTNFPTYQMEGTFDALSRSVQSVEADGSIHRPEYNEAGLLESVHVSLPDPNGGVLLERTFVRDINYDEKGRRTRIQYADAQDGILTTTRYHYDPLTFRLIQLRTTRGGEAIQDLVYTYDPVGNITEIQDLAVPTRFFNNFRIDARNDYTYDALNRLIQADGREHAGQALNFGPCDNWRDNPYRVSHQAGDDMAWQNYRQGYVYDPVGNIVQMRHVVSGDASKNWTRNYSYAEDSNRLLSTQVGNQAPYVYSYHEHHGFITNLSHLSRMQWNFKDELQQTSTQQVCSGEPPETTFYVYDGGGERMRKVTEHSGLQVKRQERIYLGNVEVFRSYDANGNIEIERQSLHISDDTGRIALVDTRIQGSDEFEEQLTRYQFSNHLGSASLELDDNGNVISYEEYHPYGTTSYQARNADIRATAKRYRYTGMERDEETGLNYHFARYYLPWLGRWLSSDPIGIGDGVNVFGYVQNSPSNSTDINGKETDEAKASKIFADFLEKEGVNYKTEVRFKVKVDGEWVHGRADFMVEKKPGVWEPVEMKGKADSRWTKAQKKYLPALEKGGVWETTSSKKFDITVKGSGGGKVLHLNNVLEGRGEFKKLIDRTYWRRRKGEIDKITETHDRDNKLKKRKVEPQKMSKKPLKSKRLGGGVPGKILYGITAMYVYTKTGDAKATANTFNPVSNTLDALDKKEIDEVELTKAVLVDFIDFFGSGVPSNHAGIEYEKGVTQEEKESNYRQGVWNDLRGMR